MEYSLAMHGSMSLASMSAPCISLTCLPLICCGDHRVGYELIANPASAIKSSAKHVIGMLAINMPW
jgi:hypothetical protein